MNKGFTLIEVILSITIIGILTTILIPSAQNYSKSADELTLKQTTMVIYNDVIAYLNLQAQNHNNKYPIYGSSNSQFLGINNISSKTLTLFVRDMMSYSKILDYSKAKDIEASDFTGFTDNVGFINVTFNYKDSSKVVVEFQITDNLVNYRDVGIVKSVQYVNSKGQTYKVEI